MEHGFTMAIHAVMITAVAYVVMRFMLGQTVVQSEDRSVLLGAVALAYMVLFGHGMPRRVNPAIMQ